MKTKTKKLPEWGRLNAIPAGMIDRAYLNEPKNFVGRYWQFLKIRAIYVGLFLPFSVVDLNSSLLLGISFAFRSFFTSDQSQARRLEQQKKYATIFSKNFYSLLASGFGLISPKLVAFYFTPEKFEQKGVTAGGNYYQDKNAEVVHPESVEEIQKLIRQAAEEGKKVMPVGAGRSQGKQFLPEGGQGALVLDLDKLNTIEINATEKTATVGAGTRWADLQLAADKHKLALKVMQASNVFSVGGSIGTNIHGWDHLTGVLANTILSMDIVDAKGNVHTLTPDHEWFHFITGGAGLFGTVTHVTIQLTDNELLLEKGKDVDIKDYVDYFHDTVQSSETTRMHLYRLSLDPKNLLGSGVAVSYVKEDDNDPIVTKNLSQEDRRGTRTHQVLINLMRRFGFLRKQYWQGEVKRLLANNSPAQTTNEIMQPPINAMFNPSMSEAEWLQEYFLPGEELEPFLNELGHLLMKNKVALLNASVRFVKKHNASPLAYSHDGDRFAVVLCFNQSLQDSRLIKAKKWLREAQNLAVEHGGTYYLPYQHVSDPEVFKKAYPHAEEAQRMKEELDPDQVFASGFYQKYLAKRPEDEVNHFKVMMTNKEQFAGFLNNVLQRVNMDKLYNLLDDIMQYNDYPEEIYQELCRRLPEIMPSTLASLRRILHSLSTIKEDLGNQAKALLPDDLKVIDGLVEIGYPGRFIGAFKKNFKIIGDIVAVYEGPGVTDYIQTGFPRPYDHFQKLDYRDPNLSELGDNTATVITCYIGLHHFPEDKLVPFLKEVRRVLKDDGYFLLVDHDVKDELSLTMAHMAHSIYNAVSGVSVKEEMAEIRNFQPMSYWQELLAEQGLGYTVEGPDVHLIRTGDPSRNRMVSFVKAEPQEILQSRKGKEKILEKRAANQERWQERNAKNVSVAESRDVLFATESAGDEDANRDEPSEGSSSKMGF